MKRDYDLVRSILADTEAIPAGSFIGGFEYSEYDSATVNAHAMLLIEAGLINAEVLRMASGPPKMIISGLTWPGHDFLEASNKPGLWEKAQTHLIKPAGGVAFSVLLDWLKAQAVAA